MLTHRVIPSLLLHDGGLVKTSQFAAAKYVGDPINAVRIFNEKEVDELMLIDISASKLNRAPDFDLIEDVASECFMPLCYGGGIRSADDARRLFRIGVEKVCLQSSALANPGLLREIADFAGEQAVVFSVDVKKDWLGRTKLHTASKSARGVGDWQDVLRTAVEHGAGEILFNNVDRDGTMKGMDNALIKEAASICDVPLIAAGGVASLQDIRAATDAGASAVAAGAFFVFHGPHRAVLISYPRYSELSQLWS